MEDGAPGHDPLSPPRAPRASRTEVLATLALLGVAVGFVVWRAAGHHLAAHPSEEQCTELLDRYVEHLVRANDPKPAASFIAERRALARVKAADSPEFARCTRVLTADQAECAMRANNADEFERCTQ
jgi:hypothetical protein